MCGIVGYIGQRRVVPILLEGLKRLEYRGYDSAGLVFLQDGRLHKYRCEGKLVNLEEVMDKVLTDSSAGLGHTRWATHGPPSEANAHPHSDCSGELVVVHNGIIENFQTLREKLKAQGHVFTSQTDTEVLAHLIEEHLQGGDLVQAVREAIKEVEGSFALGVMWLHQPDRLVAARYQSPLVLGVQENGSFMASDIPALLPFTRDVIFLDDGELAVLQGHSLQVFRLDDGAPVQKEVQPVEPAMVPMIIMESSLNTIETIMKELRRMWVLGQNIPNTIGPLANMIHDVGTKLKPIPATSDEEYAALQKLFYEGFFESPLLLEVIKAGITKSIEAIKSLVQIRGTTKLQEFIKAKVEAPPVPKVEDVKMSREEAHTALKIVHEILMNFVAQYKDKDFKNIKKICSLQSHFRNQLLTYSVAKINPEVMRRIRNDSAFLDFLVNKMFQILLNKQYIKCYESKVLYSPEAFQVKLLISLEDLGFDPSKDSHKPLAASGKGEEKKEDLELKKLVQQVVENICNHFLENCLKCLWDNIKKMSSLKNHFTNLIKQQNSKQT